MAADVVVLFSGESWAQNVSTYSFNNDATPLEIGNTNGGVGDFAFSTQEPIKYAQKRLAKTLDISDSEYGNSFQMDVREIESVGGDVSSYTAQSILNRLNVHRVIPPHNGTRSAALRAALETVDVGSNTNSAVVDMTFSTYSTSEAVPGYSGNVWEYVKMACAVWHIDVLLTIDVFDWIPKIVFADRRQYQLLLDNSGVINRNYSLLDASKKIEVALYNTEWKVDEVVWGGYDASTFSLDSADTQEHEWRIDAHLISVNQPQIYAQPNGGFPGGVYPYVGPGNGIFIVTMPSGIELAPQQWHDGGGRMEVSIDEGDSSIIHVFMRAPNNPDIAPLAIEAPSPSGSEGGTIPSLFITGTGSFTEREVVTIHTGAVGDTTESEIGATIENIFVRTREQAYDLGHDAAAVHCGPLVTLSGTLAQTDLLKLSDNTHETDSFQFTAGSRIFLDDAWFRVVSASFDYGSINFTAVLDTTFGDFEDVWDGKTFQDFNNAHTDDRFLDFNITPLGQ